MKKKIIKIFIYALSVPVLAALVFGSLLLIYATSPIDADRASVVEVYIPTGASFLKATSILQRAGLVKNRPLFYSLAMVKNASRSIRAGEYEISTALSPSGLIDKLLRGEIKKYRVTIHEDFNLKEIAARLKEFKMLDQKAFFALARDEQFLHSMGIFADSIEGYLYPDTYLFNRSMTTRQMMRAMVDRFWSKITPDMINQAAERGLSPHELVTFASLVGRETGYRAEKPLVAAVFYNRIKKRMPLQSDPTTVYDLEDFDGRVLRSHYRRDSPYNTYRIRGLPPGPIGNPGLDSFLAVLNPADVDYLYFVSQKDGTHFFSSTLDEHNNAVRRFRQTRRAN
ncbi:MAG: endolytic transglycosylase MltG [Smithellaceae bacterium]